MKLLRILLIAILAGLGAGVSAKDYHLDIGQFTKLSIDDSVNVVYSCVPDSTGTIAFSAPEELADAFIFQLNKGDLKIKVATEVVNRSDLPTIHVYSDFLTHATNSGLGTLRIERPAPCPEICLKVMGNGTIEASDVRATVLKGKISTGNGTLSISGSGDRAEYTMVGTGTIQADLFKAQAVKCRCLGGGTIGCWPEATLKVDCLGSTKVYYKGEPIVTKRGGGQVIPIE